jgi:hypothetical protein
MDMRITVGGDAETGWLVDIHDGFKQGCYSPPADTPELAAVLALQIHAGIAGRPFEFPRSPMEDDREMTKAEQKAADEAEAKAKADENKSEPIKPADALARAGIAAPKK